MKHTVKTFKDNGNTIRYIEIDGSQWLFAVDACRILQIKNTSTGVAAIPDSFRRTISCDQLDFANLTLHNMESQTDSLKIVKHGYSPPAFKARFYVLIHRHSIPALIFKSRRKEAEQARLMLLKIWGNVQDEGAHVGIEEFYTKDYSLLNWENFSDEELRSLVSKLYDRIGPTRKQIYLLERKANIAIGLANYATNILNRRLVSKLPAETWTKEDNEVMSGYVIHHPANNKEFKEDQAYLREYEEDLKELPEADDTDLQPYGRCKLTPGPLYKTVIFQENVLLLPYTAGSAHFSICPNNVSPGHQVS